MLTGRQVFQSYRVRVFVDPCIDIVSLGRAIYSTGKAIIDLSGYLIIAESSKLKCHYE